MQINQFSRSLSQAQGQEKKLPGYRSAMGFISVLLILFACIVLGILSFLLNDLFLFKTGCIFIAALMAMDLMVVHKNVLKRKWYIAHHALSFFWAILIFLQADFFLAIGAAFLSYMLAGAFFRRLKTLTIAYFPKNRRWINIFHTSMMFFDFCDPLVIILFWPWFSSLSISHQFFYYAIIVTRLSINSKSYPRELRALKNVFLGKKSKTRL